MQRIAAALERSGPLHDQFPRAIVRHWLDTSAPANLETVGVQPS